MKYADKLKEFIGEKGRGMWAHEHSYFSFDTRHPSEEDEIMEIGDDYVLVDRKGFGLIYIPLGLFSFIKRN